MFPCVLQMEMLSQKQNGTVGGGGGGGEETEEQEQEEKKEHTATIKGLWKKAFKSLKSGGEQKWSVSRNLLARLPLVFSLPCGPHKSKHTQGVKTFLCFPLVLNAQSIAKDHFKAVLL